jgi:hypothetical protein
MDLVLQILWIYVIIKPLFDLMQSMSMILCLKLVLYVIALDPGTIIMIQVVGFSIWNPVRFIYWVEKGTASCFSSSTVCIGRWR